MNEGRSIRKDFKSKMEEVRIFGKGKLASLAVMNYGILGT